jgi:hypothetical protein
MDKWKMILDAAGSMWEKSREYVIAKSKSYDEYCIERDLYKARRIFDLYGYEWLYKFVR